MIEFASIVISLIVGFLAGNFRRETVEQIKTLKEQVNQKKDKPVEDSKKSTLIDPLDPAYEARRQYMEQMEELNRYE